MTIAPRGSLAVGLDALRANPLRALLSTLGVVMGVGAMVSVLSLITSGAALVQLDSGAPPRGFGVIGVLATHFRDAEMTTVAGETFADSETGVVVLNARAAGIVARDSASPARAVGRMLELNGAPHRVVAVVDGGRQSPSALAAYVPVEAAATAIPGSRVPAITVTAARIEKVDSLRVSVERWARSRYGERWRERVTVANNRARVEQASAAMGVFKLLMGAITGVSLLVGGVGIMNVLLASVAERTREIGIRKATGARDRDILAQFLAEAVAITSAGAALGVALGLGIAFLTAAIMRARTNAPVHAAMTPGTILFAAGLSVLIGLVFGLYPALRASRLSPIEAIRHE